MRDSDRKWILSDENGHKEELMNDDVIQSIKSLMYMGHSHKIIIERIV